MQKLETIHMLRGVAALLVVLMHFSNFIEQAAPGLWRFLANGYLGVDIFFILSGFIIYISTEAPAARQARAFFVRRFCRIALPAWVALAITVVLQPPYLKDLMLSSFFIPLQNAAPPFYGYSVLIVAWTLSYELFFYSVFTIALSFSFGRAHRGLVVAAILAAVIALSQGTTCCSLNPYQAPLFNTGLSWFPDQLISLAANPMVLEFAIGIFLGWAYSARYLERMVGPGLLVSAVAALYAIARFQYAEGHGLSRGGLLAVVIVFYALCLQVWLDRHARAFLDRLSSMFFGGLALLLGEISYSIYLIHPSIKTMMLKVAKWMSLPQSASLQFALFCAAVCLTYVGGKVFYRWVEIPSQNLGRRWSARIALGRADLMSRMPG